MTKIAKTKKGIEKEKELEKKISLLDIEQLQIMLSMLKDNFEDGATIVYLKVLDELEIKMGEAEFIKYCDSL